MKKITLNYKGKKVNLELKEVKGSLSEAIGLMFCPREKAKALLFSFNNPVSFTIHSFFVFFDFVAIWLDENNKLISIKKVNPWKINIKPKSKFHKLIEIPASKKYNHILKLLDED